MVQIRIWLTVGVNGKSVNNMAHYATLPNNNGNYYNGVKDGQLK